MNVAGFKPAILKIKWVLKRGHMEKESMDSIKIGTKVDNS